MSKDNSQPKNQNNTRDASASQSSGGGYIERLKNEIKKLQKDRSRRLRLDEMRRIQRETEEQIMTATTEEIEALIQRAEKSMERLGEQRSVVEPLLKKEREELEGLKREVLDALSRLVVSESQAS